MEHVNAVQDPTIIDGPVNICHHLSDICGGNFSYETNKVWMFNRNYVCLFDANDGNYIQRWKCNYGEIKAVYEVLFNTNYLAVIATLNSEDVIILLNTTSFSLVKSIYVPERISTVCSVNYSSVHLSSNFILNKFNGILAVGCYGGRVFLINLKLDQVFAGKPVHQPLPIRVINGNYQYNRNIIEHESLELFEGDGFSFNNKIPLV